MKTVITIERADGSLTAWDAGGRDDGPIARYGSFEEANLSMSAKGYGLEETPLTGVRIWKEGAR